MLLGRILRPALNLGLSRPAIVAVSNRGQSLQDVPTRPSFQSITPYRPMATASTNYHYHEKPADHKHDALWRAERYLSLALLGVLPASWVIPHPLMDYAVAISLVVHVHWGVEAIVTDYIRPSIFGSVIPKVSIALVYVLSILAAGGLFLFNWTDVGLTQAMKMIARI